MKILCRALTSSVLVACETACAETALDIPIAKMRPTIHILNTLAPSSRLRRNPVTGACRQLSLLRRTYQIIDHLPLFANLGSRPPFNLSKTALNLRQVRLALRIDISHDLSSPHRQLALLPALALLDERPHAREQLFVGRGRRRRRSVANTS